MRPWLIILLFILQGERKYKIRICIIRIPEMLRARRVLYVYEERGLYAYNIYLEVSTH
jgi:hypothetical protein